MSMVCLRVISGVIIGVVVILLCAGCIRLIKKTNVQIPENRLIKSMAYLVLDLYQYTEFEKLFREHEEDMRAFVELSWESVLEKKEYWILFDEHEYLNAPSKNWSRSWINILYSDNTFASKKDKKMAEALNKNDNLIEILNSIQGKGVIIDIFAYDYDGHGSQMIKFDVDSESTPFIRTAVSYGCPSSFAYCESKEGERYGYENIEDNWYMYLAPEHEGGATTFISMTTLGAV